MVVGIVVWVLFLGTCAVWWGWSRRRARTEPPARTPQQVWDDTDPEHRRGIAPPGADGGWGSGV